MKLERKRNIFLIFIVYVLALTVISFLTVLFFKFALHQDIHMLRQKGRPSDIGHVLLYLYMILLVAVFQKYLIKLSWKNIGLDFKIPHWKKEVLSGWLTTLSLAFIYSLILALFQKMTISLDAPPQKWFSLFLHLPSAFGVAIVEEYVFRGFVFNLLRRAFPLVFSVIVSSMIFSYVHCFGEPTLWHSDFLKAIALFILGCMLCTAYVYKNSLFLPIGLHAGLVTFRLLTRKTNLFSYVEETLLFGSNNDPRTGIMTWTLFLLLLVYFLWKVHKSAKRFQLLKSTL